MFKRIALALMVIGGIGGSALAFAGLTAPPAAACTHTT